LSPVSSKDSAMSLLSDLLQRVTRGPKPKRAPFSNPFLEGNYAPVGRESESPSLEVLRGEVPRDLRGALYRMSPAPRFEPPNPSLYHWFDGDGMIDAFFLEDGRVSHKNRWVRTKKFALEDRAGHSLFGGLRDIALSTPLEGFLALGFTPLELIEMRILNMLGKAPSEEATSRVISVLDRGNTSIATLAGRLVSLEEGFLGYEIDPKSLATLGRVDFDGTIQAGRGGMVAHPKVEAGTGTIYTFAYWGDRGRVSYYVIGADGKTRLAREFETPYASMMHDFSVTETRAVFYHLPAVLHLDDLKDPNTIRWEPSRGARIGVVLRDDPRADVRWFDIPICYVYHPMNAFDDGNAVVLDIVRYPRLPLFDSGGENPNPQIEEYAPGNLVRLRLDLETGKTTETILDDAACEFPITDPRFAMRPYRYGWVAARRGATCGRGTLNAIGRVDFQTGNVDYRILGASTYTSEPIFVPRSEGAAEGDGYLLAVVYHAEEGASDLLVLDALDLAAEPIAVVRTKQRVPYGFHGTWVESAR